MTAEPSSIEARAAAEQATFALRSFSERPLPTAESLSDLSGFMGYIDGVEQNLDLVATQLGQDYRWDKGEYTSQPDTAWTFPKGHYHRLERPANGKELIL